jgi:hypothetical protein
MRATRAKDLLRIRSLQERAALGAWAKQQAARIAAQEALLEYKQEVTRWSQEVAGRTIAAAMLSERGLVLAGSRRGAMRQTLAVENLAGLEDQARSDWTDARIREQGLSKLHERLQAVEEAENLRLEQIESDDVEVRRRLS